MNYKKFNIYRERFESKEKEEEYKKHLKEYEDFVNSYDQKYFHEIFIEGLKLGMFKQKRNGKIVTLKDNDILEIGINAKDGYHYKIIRMRKPPKYTKEELQKIQAQIEAKRIQEALQHQRAHKKRFLLSQDQGGFK